MNMINKKKKTYFINQKTQGFNNYKINDDWIEVDFDNAMEALTKVNTIPTYTWTYDIDTEEFSFKPRTIDYIGILQAQAKQNLISTDYLMTPDTFEELSADKQIQLKEYRKYLRAVMNGIEDFINVNENTKLKELGDF